MVVVVVVAAVAAAVLVAMVVVVVVLLLLLPPDRLWLRDGMYIKQGQCSGSARYVHHLLPTCFPISTGSAACGCAAPALDALE